MIRLPGTSRERRALRIGVIAIGAILIVGRGIPALHRIEGDLQRRGESLALAIEAARREAALSSADSGVERSASLLIADSPTAGAAIAVAYLTDLAQEFDLTLHSVRPSGDSAFVDGVAEVTVHLSASGNTVSAVALLAQLDAGPRLFRVRTLDVAQPAPASPAGIEESLRLELTVDAAVQRLGSEGREPDAETRAGRSAARSIVRAPRLERSPFRVDGGAPMRVVETTPEVAAPVAPPPPVVAVRAIVGGPPWQALLRGIAPGSADRVVRPGDRFGAVEVRAIGAEFVVLTSADSSWTITLPSRGR